MTLSPKFYITRKLQSEPKARGSNHSRALRYNSYAGRKVSQANENSADTREASLSSELESSFSNEASKLRIDRTYDGTFLTIYHGFRARISQFDFRHISKTTFEGFFVLFSFFTWTIMLYLKPNRH